MFNSLPRTLLSRTPRMTRALRFAAVLLAAAAFSAPVAEAQTAGRGVGSVTVDSPGIGYTSTPSVAFAGGGGSGAAATATLTPSVGSVALISGGSGYTTAPSVMFTGGGGGSGAAADAVLPPRGVASVNISNGGVYNFQPSVTFGLPQTAGGRQATGTAVRSGLNVQSVTITDPGSGYTSPPSVTFQGGLGGTIAQGAAVLEAAAVASVDVTAAGSGYTSVPGVMFSGGGGGSGATANAALSNSVLSVSVTSPGSGYTSAPSVSFLGGGGRDAAATATLEATVVTGVALSSPVLGDTFERAEPIEATVTFAHAVDVDTTGGTPQLALNVGSNTRQASYVSGTGTTELKFRYTAVQADVDSDGITIGASALALNSGTIRLAGSSTVDAMLGLGSHAITDSADHKVDGTALTAAAVSGVSITSTPASGDTYRLGEQIDVTVTFNRTVNVVTTGGTPRLALTVGLNTRQADYTSGTGTRSLVFRYTTASGDVDEDGIGVAAGALTLNSGAINDARDATVAATLGLGTHAISAAADHKVATPPVISSIFTSSPVGSAFERGERIEVTVNFNRAVDVTGTPQFALTIGTETRQADYVSGTGTTALVFRYTVVQADSDPDGISIPSNALTLNGGSIRAVTADRTDASLGLSGISNQAGRNVDGTQFTAAAVSTAAGAVQIASSPASGDTYTLGERIAVRVTFTRRVDVTGMPQVELTVGATARQADYASGSGTNTLIFHYVVQGANSGGDGGGGEDADTVDGIAIPANALTLNGGAIDDARDATEAATLTHGAVAASTSHKVNGGPNFLGQPRVIDVAVESAPSAGRTYGTGETILVRVTFDRVVMVTGSPQLALTIGTEAGQASYESGSGTPDLVFRYVVRPGDTDPDGISILANALTLNDGDTILLVGEIADEGMNPRPVAMLGLGGHALPDGWLGQGNHKVDAPPLTPLTPRPSLAIDAPQVVEGASGTTATLRFTVTMNRTATRTVTVSWEDTGSGTATAGAADAPGADYVTLAPGTLTFAPGTTEQTIDVTVIGDAVDEPDETVVVRLHSPVNATLPTGAEVGTGTITDDDDADLKPTFGDAQVPPQRYVQNVEIAPLVLPAATGGDGPLTYTLTGPGPSGALLEGLTYTPPGGAAGGAAMGGTLTGTPAVAAEEAVWTLTATDIDGDTATLTFTVEVAPDLVPTFGDARVPVQRYVQGTAIAPLVLPAATGGDLPLAYALTGPGPSGALPEGLVYTPPGDAAGGAATGGTLTGTPAVAAEEAVWTLTVTDADGDTATLTFTVEVAPDLVPTFGDARVPVQRYVQGTAIAPLVLPAATGGDLPLVYALTGPGPSGALLEGLTYTPPGDAAGATGGTLTGTPAVAAEEAVWTLTVTDADGDTATLTFTFEVEPDLMPTFGDARVPVQRYVQDVAIAPLVLPAATGGNGPLTYALTGPGPSGALLEGLTYTPPGDAAGGAAAGGTLTGTPVVVVEASTWTLTVTDFDGDTATLVFTVEVAPDLMPTFGDARMPVQRYVQDVAIAPLALPAATGGNGALTYTLTPELPEGLTYTPPGDAAGGGVLAGTPAVAQAPAHYTLNARDVDGDMAALSFTIEVVDRLRERLKGVNEAILADLSRAMTGSTVDAVSGRIGQALAPDGAGAVPMEFAEEMASAFAGMLRSNEEAIGEGTWSWRRGLDGRRFALALTGAGGGGAGSVGVWGAGDYRPLSGGGSGVDWDGHLFGAHVGMDARFGSGGLAGLALSVTEGRLDYTDTSALALGEAVEGKYESEMASAHPYLGWAWGKGTHAWASLGYGQGTIDIDDGEAGRQESGSTLRSAVAGGSVRMFSGEGPGGLGAMTVDLKGEAWTTRLEVEDNGDRIAGLRVRTHRVRVSAEGARAFALGGGGALTPSVELGMRLDGGDGETGAGVELGGGVDYAHPAWGLSADVSGRAVVVHEGGSDDWSVGGAVRLEPASGLGLSLRLAPSYGDTGSGLARLWEDGVSTTGAAASTSNDPSPAARLDTEMGYGLSAFAGTLTPYGGFALSEGGAHGYRMGARYLLGPALELGVEGERREGRSERAEHGLMLRGRMRW